MSKSNTYLLCLQSENEQVEERAIPVDELVDADEVFCTGTAVVVGPVGSITYQNRRYMYLRSYLFF